MLFVHNNFSLVYKLKKKNYLVTCNVNVTLRTDLLQYFKKVEEDNTQLYY